MQQRRQLQQACLSGQVDRLLAHTAYHILDNRQIDRSSRQHYLRTFLAYQTVEQRRPVGSRPALGLPVIRTDVAGDQWLTLLRALFASSLLNLLR